MVHLDLNSYSREQEKCACDFQFQNHIHESENLCALARAIFGRRELSAATVGVLLRIGRVGFILHFFES